MPALAKDLVGLGIPTAQAEAIGSSVPTAVTTAGTAIGTATAIKATLSILTTATSQTGAILPSTAPLMVEYFGYVPSTTTAKLYPHASAATINGSVAGTSGVSVAQGKSFVARRTSATNWLVVVSA